LNYNFFFYNTTGKEEERQMFQQMQAMAQKQVGFDFRFNF
jgi:hypothetical protein